MENLGLTRVHTMRIASRASLRQNTRKTESGFQFHRIRERNLTHQLAITSTSRQKSKITPLELSQLRALNGQPVALVAFAMIATIAGASVTVDGTNAASHGGYDF